MLRFVDLAGVNLFKDFYMRVAPPRLRREQTAEQRMVGGHGRAPKNPDPHACMYVFCDLACAAIDFGIIEYLVLASDEAIKRGLGQIHFVYVPAANDSYRIHGTPDPLPDEWRIQNILMQIPWLSPMCVGVTFCNTREQAALFLKSVGDHIFPSDYSVEQITDGMLSAHVSREIIGVNKGRDYRHIRATASSKYYVQRWLDRYANGKLPVTLTLREGPRDVERNSNLAAWVAFAKSLDSEIYCPIFVRDTETYFGGVSQGRNQEDGSREIEKFVSFPEASLNLHARAALYELSHVNLSVPVGPFSVCVYNKSVNYLGFRIVCENAYSTSEEYLNWLGMKKGESYHFAGPSQKLVWEDDTFEVISREFKNFQDLISG